MKSISIWVALTISVTCWLVASAAPVASNPVPAFETSIPTTTSRQSVELSTSPQPPTTTAASRLLFASDYVDERELAQVLHELERAEADSIRQPKNFLADELSAEEIMRMFETGPSSSNLHSDDDSPDSSRAETETATDLTQTGDSDGLLDAANDQVGQVETAGLADDQLTTTTTIDPRLYVDSDEEFQRLLNSSRDELLDNNQHPANFVKDDAELEFVSRQLVEKGDDAVESRVNRWQNGLPMVFEPDTCPICHDDMEKGVESLEIHCGHTFHKQCIKSYVDYKRTKHNGLHCPVCRRRIKQSFLSDTFRDGQ